jgi:glycosyltransferase involved in cell wall biosynthesis
LRWAHEAEAAKDHWLQRCKETEAQHESLAQAHTQLAEALAAKTAKTEELISERDDAAHRCCELERKTAELSADLALANQAAIEMEARVIREAYARDLELESVRQKSVRRSMLGRRVYVQNLFARALRKIYCLLRRKPVVRPDAQTRLSIVQVNTHDIIGGAERTSYDLHVRYRQHGLGPTLIVGGKSGADADVFKIPFREMDWKRAPVWRDRWGITEILYPTPLLGCFEWPQLRNADVVHIHNMHGHYWNSAALVPLGFQHPLVITLHDEYTLTGDCCYSHDCLRWQSSCGRCPQIGLDKMARYSLGERDRTRLNVRIKRAIFRAPRAYPLVVVTPTRWLANRARVSPNLRHLPVVCINNGVDLSYWKPMPQPKARQALGLPLDKTIGLIVASNLLDRRKGFDVALEAIRQLPPNSNLLFVIVGTIDDSIRQRVAGFPVIATDYVTEKIKMLHLFGAADFVFAMSRVDNLPYMCVEALACGRPVFGSQVGGIPEIIHDPVLGWLAPTPFRTDQIVQTLLEIDRESTVVRHRRSAACRNSAELRFSLELMTNRYLALYQELLVASRARRPVDLNVLAGVGV